MKKLLQCLAITFTLFASGANGAGPTEVVYHIDDAESQGIKGLRNIRNHLDVSPQTKIIVVTHANGVDIMMEGAKDKKNGIEYAPLVGALKSRGVRFEVCEITLKNRNLKKDQFILDTDYTPSGVVRVADLQNQSRFAYIKP
ncbi:MULTISPECIES: DsrE family protein [Polynucleobacter]|jgi:intracellular sulfur oxidation DsrE/DsrF family protein|uniref:DsrE family protein n=1 Tax=Polynucleobacter TaxID=44013 RepID=UPI001BFE6756|nr:MULTISPECIES: DsrE family protein [Polynucleobacter]MBU3561505.1 DsrE family protein [Polynucleobacter hallstattensis]QWE15483.1 DsrE family protein [Polynucleobacter sp. AP-Sving-400A-A2]